MNRVTEALHVDLICLLVDGIVRQLILRNAVCITIEYLENNKTKCIDIIYQLNKHCVRLYFKCNAKMMSCPLNFI